MGEREIKYLVFLTSWNGSQFEAESEQSTMCIESFDSENEAIEYLKKREPHVFDVNIFIAKDYEAKTKRKL